MATPTFILPSAPTYTEGFVNGLNVYPNPTNFVANQVSFTRATTATRTNAAGLIELTPYNLVQYSEQFGNVAWSKPNVIVTENVTTAPNGTLTGDTVTGNGVSTVHDVLQTGTTTLLAGTVYTVSIYAKKDTNNFIQLTGTNAVYGATAFANFDLNTGAIGTIGSTATATIQSVGNGWYRCSMTATATGTSSANSFIVALTTSATSVRGEVNTLTTSVFIWGAQLVEGTDALPYQLTETRLNRPRVDFSLGGCPNLLLEPQRTNNARWSEDLTNVLWSKTTASVVISANSTSSPSGVQNADGVSGATGAATWGGPDTLNQQIVGLTSNTLYTTTIYLRSSTTSSQVTLVLRDQSTGGQSQIVCNLTSSWQRFEISRTTGATTTALGVILCAATADFFAWGAQLEAGAFPTSYIPTTSASVTRNTDVAQLTGAQTLIGQTEGTVYWEGTLSNGLNDIFYLNRSITNSVVLYKNANNTISFRIYYGSAFFNLGNANTYTGTVKIAAAYKSGNSVLYINGVQTGTSSTAFVFTGDLSEIVLNATGYFFATDFSKNVKSAAVYNTRLTNAELATLTTL